MKKIQVKVMELPNEAGMYVSESYGKPGLYLWPQSSTIVAFDGVTPMCLYCGVPAGALIMSEEVNCEVVGETVGQDFLLKAIAVAARPELISEIVTD